MIVLFAAVLALVNLLGLLLTALGLPGNWLMVLCTALVAWLQQDAGMFSPWTLLTILGLAIVGEVLEFLSGLVGSKRAGGTWRGSTGAILGGILGALLGTALIPLPGLGTLLGACLGAFLGAVTLELAAGRALRFSVRAGRGAALGYGFGVLAKLGVGTAIWLTATTAAFWP